MKRKYNKAIATLTLIIMTIGMMMPIGSNAAAVVTSPSGGTFNEASANDGTVTGSIDVPLEWTYYDNSYNQNDLPEGLKLTITENKGDAKVVISGKAINHNAADSRSVTITFRTRKSNLLWYSYQDEPKTFNIKFQENPPVGGGEPTGVLVRDKVRVLEVYPSIMTNSTASASSDPSKPTQELYNLLKGKSQYDITSMSLNKFISLRDEINGNYDVVYFGKGTYCRNSITDTYFGNDITELRADQVLEYINAGQLCIFHEDAFKGSTQDGTASKSPVTIMYNKFNSIKSRSNVKVISNISNSVFNNLASEYIKYNQRPILVVTKQPVSYRSAGQPIASHNLTFEYGVYDPDLSKDDSLSVELYIDRNCNSLFESFERVASREVKNGEYDTITYNMTPDLTGVYFWKLVAADSADMGAKSEITDIIRVKGDELVIKVLQIKPNVDNNASLSELFSRPVTGGLPGETLGYRPGEFRIDVTEATVNEFNAGNADKHLRDLNGNYDMLILGFADNYSDDKELNTSAIAEIKGFIATKQSAMFTHDSIHYEYNDALTSEFWDDAGQTMRGGRGETAGLLGFDNHSSLSGEYSNLNNKYKLEIYQTINPYPDEAKLVRPVNSNAITLYPYNLESVPQNLRSVAPTHYQWYKLNLEDENVIPLFNLYKESSGERVNDDAMNNYYTYTKDNITYSGTGHKSGYPEYEIKLFINTAFKAHAVANKKPVILLKEPTGNTFNTNTDFINLKFELDDDYDNKLQYWVEADYDNNGTFERKYAEGLFTPTKTDITKIIENRSTVGPFKIRITAKETSETGAVSVLEKVMECVNKPVITPTVSFTYPSDPDHTITSCLIGETIKINTRLTATGNLSPEQSMTPTYDLDAKYSDMTPVLNVANENVGTFTFYPQPEITPSPGYIDKQKTVTVNPGSPTILNVNTKVKYTIGGELKEQPGLGFITINNGQVDISVKDTEGRAVRDVVVKDYGTPLADDTSISGSITLNNQIGSHQYSIEVPTGYKLTAGCVKAECPSASITNTTDSIASVVLTGPNNHWIVTYTLTLDIGVDANYYKVKSDGSVSLLGIDDPLKNYYLRCPNGSAASYIALVHIDEITAVNVKGVDFELETVKAVPGDADAAIINSAITIGGTVPAELNPATVKQLYTSNGIDKIPVDGTYAGKSYYIVVKVDNTNLQKVRIKNVKLTMETGPAKVFSLDSNVIFGEPATPLLR